MSDSRKDVLSKALEAEVGGLAVDPGTLFTDDVVGWSPLATVSGLTALADRSAVNDEAYSNVTITYRGLDEVGNKVVAEWVIEGDHTGPLVLGEDAGHAGEAAVGVTLVQAADDGLERLLRPAFS